MEFYAENDRLCIHNTNRNLLTLELSFIEEKEVKKPVTTPLLHPEPPSVISDISLRENIHIEVEHPFGQHFEFHHKFLVKYLLSIIYDGEVHLKVTCFENELKFDAVFETLSELLRRKDGTQMEIVCDDVHKRISVAGRVVYETRTFF